jgi:hypothetical protein
MSTTDLFKRFESLGENCEFGFVQRHYGVEPVTLLRWAGTHLDGLIHALRQGFADLYRLEDLRPVTANLAADSKYHLSFHTDIPIVEQGGQLAFDAQGLKTAYPQELRKIGFLRDQFLDSLETGEKIYLYKAADPPGWDKIEALHAALNAYGPQRLLVVFPATPELPYGEVKLAAKGLKVAGIYRLAPHAHAEDAPFEAWSAICEAAADSPWDPDTAGAASFPIRHWNPEPTLALSAVRSQIVNGLYRGLFNRLPDGGGAEDADHRLARAGLSEGLRQWLRAALESEEFRNRHGRG